MEKKIDGKTKSAASIPANYVSILQLQERWMKEKERKQKEKDLPERGVKQQVNVQRRREEEEEEEPRVKLEGKSSGGGFRMNRCKKEPNCVEKEEVKVSAIVSKKDDDEGDSKERKKKWSKKESKKNKGGSVEEVFKCGSKAYIPREINPVEEEITGEKIVQNRENAACNSFAVETQFQHLWIKKRMEEDGRDRQVKGPAKLNSRQDYYRNQRHETRTMVWVKKGENNGAGGGNGVNP